MGIWICVRPIVKMFVSDMDSNVFLFMMDRLMHFELARYKLEGLNVALS